MGKTQKKLWIGLVVLALLSPLGILLPQTFNAGDAWGEWSADTLQHLLGYVPSGLKKYAEIWQAPLADYNFWGEGADMGRQILSYIISGFLGLALTVSVIYLVSKVLFRSKK